MDDLHDRPRGLPGRRRPGPRGAPPGADATELLARIVPDRVAALAPSSGWRIYTIGSSLPGLDPATYRLEIAGAVERPVTYTLADLRGLPRATQVSDFHCVTGGAWTTCAGPVCAFATCSPRPARSPRRGRLVARRNLVKNLHLLAAVAWMLALAMVLVVGNRARDDRRWLPGARAPQGRFNAGQTC
jgi:Oxidoreductase molybdopterin binding domain